MRPRYIKKVHHMPFATTKSPEELAANKKANLIKLFESPKKYIDRALKKRGVPPEIKSKLSDMSTELDAMIQYFKQT